MRQALISGMFWVTLSMTLIRGARYLAFFIIAGLISPADFGDFTELTVVVVAMMLLQGFGLGHALIFRKENVEEASDTILFLLLAFGLLFLLAGWFGAPLIGGFYRNDNLVSPFRVYMLMAFLRATQAVPLRLFEKDLDFRKKFRPGLVGSVAYTVVTVALALRGAGLWALVMGEVIGTLGEMITCWIISPYRPRWRFNRTLAIQDLRFGWAVLGGTILILLFQSIDRVTISTFLDSSRLGYYAFAFTIASLPEVYFVRAVNTVLLPSYTRPGLDHEKRRALFFRATAYCLAMGILFVIGVLFFSRFFLQAAYGEKWLPAVGPLYVLVFFGFFRALAAVSQDLMVGLGRPELHRMLNGIRVIPALLFVYWGIRSGGIGGVAMVMTISTFISFVAGWGILIRLIDTSVGDFRRHLSGPLLAAIPAVLAAEALRRTLPAEPRLLPVLLAGCATTAVYAASWLLCDGRMRREWGIHPARSLTSPTKKP